jgi:hypothetical protein
MKTNLPKFNPNEVLELYETLGYSLWMLQSLELSLSHYLVLAHKISTDTAVAQVKQIFEQTSTKTLGSLLSDLKKYNDLFFEKIIKKLENVLEDRNWLVHKVYAVNQSDMFSEYKASNSILKIRKIGDDAIELSKFISKNTDEVITNKGFYTIQELDRRTKEIMDSWTKK